MLKIITGLSEKLASAYSLRSKNLIKVPHSCRNVDSVLPFKLSPHASELKDVLELEGVGKRSSGITDLCLIAVCRLDIVHDVDMNVT